MPGGWPLFRRAPGRLLRSGSTALMILVSVALLAGLVAAGPLFGYTTNAGGLARRLAAIPVTASPTERPVVRVTAYQQLGDDVQQRLRSLVDGVPYVGNPVTGVYADAWQLEEQHPTPYILANGHRLPAVLFARTGAEAALRVVRGTPGAPGVWLPETTARTLEIGPGDKLEAGKTYHQTVAGCGAPFSPRTPDGPVTDTRTTLRVAGTYAVAADGVLPVGSYFSDLGTDLPSDPGFCPSTGLMVIGDQATIQGAITKLDETPIWSHTATLTGIGSTPAHLAAAAAGAQRLQLAASEPGTAVARLLDPRGGTGTRARIDSGLPRIHQDAVADAAAAAAQGRGIAYAGAVLGLAAVVMALRALAQRRRRETEMLIGLGTPTRIVIGANVLELLLPTLAGAAAGWAVAWATFDAFGPQPSLAGSALVSSGIAAALVVLVVLAADAVVTAGQARQVSRSLSGAGPARFGGQWLPLLTGATVLGVASVLLGGNASFNDPISAVLPILVLACGCSLIVRAVSLLPFRSAGDADRPDRLVTRGLRRTGVAVADLVIVVGIGVGILAYGVLSATQVSQSVADKAAVLAGASSTAHIPHSWLLGGGGGAEPRVPVGTSVVWRATGVVSPDGVYDVLAVNPLSFRAAADWGDGPSLAAARSALASLTPVAAKAPLPALFVGPVDRSVGSTAEIKVGFTTASLVVREHLDAFPGATRPTVVVDARAWFPRLGATEDPSRFVRDNLDYAGSFATWVWSSSSQKALTARLESKSIVPSSSLSLEQARATPELTSALWAAAYQVVLGLAAAALSGLALVVAVDRRVARAAPVDLVLRRFGFRPRRLLWLRARELALTGVAALLVAVGPFLVMAVLLPRLAEPESEVPPSLVVGVGWLPLIVGVVVTFVIVALAVLAAARRSARLEPGEVLRDDA